MAIFCSKTVCGTFREEPKSSEKWDVLHFHRRHFAPSGTATYTDLFMGLPLDS